MQVRSLTGHGAVFRPSCAAALFSATALPARAGIIVSVESVSASPGTTGNTLEVDMQNTGSTR